MTSSSTTQNAADNDFAYVTLPGRKVMKCGSGQITFDFTAVQAKLNPWVERSSLPYRKPSKRAKRTRQPNSVMAISYGHATYLTPTMSTNYAEMTGYSENIKSYERPHLGEETFTNTRCCIPRSLESSAKVSPTFKRSGTAAANCSEPKKQVRFSSRVTVFSEVEVSRQMSQHLYRPHPSSFC